MRKTIFLIGASFAVLTSLSSCQTGADVESLYSQAPEIIATLETEDNTKSMISVDGEGVGTIYWTPADKINIFYGTTSTLYTSQNTENALTAVFRTTDIIGSTESASDNIWGLYPYDADAVCDGNTVTTTIPSTQYAVPDTFDDDLFPTLAHSETNALKFYNVCGGIKFSLSRGDIYQITFRGNNSEDLAGRVSLTFSNDSPAATVLSAEKEIYLLPKDASTFENGTNYYLVLLPCTLSDGFTMIFNAANGSVGTFNYSEKAITIKRSVFSRKANIDTYASFTASSFTEPQAVDLGLSVKWGSFNLGATKPEEFGDYYAWGEVIPYYADGHSSDSPCSDWRIIGGRTITGYNYESYRWFTNEKPTKYCPLDKTGFWVGTGSPDGKTTLDIRDDAANAVLGGTWRMPTEEEFDELKSNCNYYWVNVNGTLGRKFYSKKDGYTDKFIFLPAARWRVGTELSDSDYRYYGEYWSSSLYNDSPYNSWQLSIASDLMYVGTSSRKTGLTIRPVCE